MKFDHVIWLWIPTKIIFYITCELYFIFIVFTDVDIMRIKDITIGNNDINYEYTNDVHAYSNMGAIRVI